MIVSNIPMTLLSRMGKNGALAMAISILIGLAFPAIAAYIKPYLRELILLLLTLSFLRVEPDALHQVAKRPLMVIMSALWLLILLPVFLFWLFKSLGFQESYPGLTVILLLMMTAPPVMSSPAMAYVLGLNGAISLSVMVLSMLLVPLTAPFITDWLMPGLLPISALDLAKQLTLILLGSWIASRLLKALIGQQRLNHHKHEIDGLNVLVLFAFAIALMDGVATHFIDQPVFASLMTLATFAMAFLQIGLTLLVFSPFGLQRSWPLALAVGNRNMGMMVVAIGGLMPDMSWLWFALAQFPIYMLPLILTPIFKHQNQKDTQPKGQ
ncbi:MAG: sodium:proton symporter [Cohaesibacter sp.]|nr:sodium:proton symporter [Cohaesibacter sp.]